eukprot:TRINITY_DN1194_c0_g2_i3.p1 TRINITY_DN1194_c0_g2~~TRINITY_DN1194_c0_g2_i3.p1  ORF type:complete len:979 (+),score=154.06 TRINITY_DN1194_c0_g2_i3:145-3081(+)
MKHFFCILGAASIYGVAGSKLSRGDVTLAQLSSSQLEEMIFQKPLTAWTEEPWAKDEVGINAKLPPCNLGYNRTYKSRYKCVDINECSSYHLNRCQNHNCANTQGSFVCKCHTGYNGSHPTCTDIDECTTRNATTGQLLHTCTLNAKFGQVCNNTVGSFVCRCAPGWAPSFFPNFTHLNCSSVNECKGQTHNCHPHGNCTDTTGSFTCKCNDGYLGDGVSCADVDECVLGLHSCHRDAECTDTIGSFTCECKIGFAGNGTNCTEINECNATEMVKLNYSSLNSSIDAYRGVQAGVHTCQANTSKCTNTWGSFLCACNAGYSGTGKECEDTNECTEQLDNCTLHSICTNTVGSYTCACKPGFKLANGTDGPNGTCIDIHECYINALARGGGTTTTTTGDGIRPPYKYGRFVTSKASLLSTHHGSSHGHQHRIGSDTDSDTESSTIPNALCHEKADCKNNFGSYTCTCQRGYYGDGLTCQNMNECTSGLHNCDQHAHCVDTIGSFKCACLPGYNGSGTFYTGGWPPIDGCWDYDECTNTSQAFLKHNLTNMSKLQEVPYNFTNYRACVTGGVCTNNVGSFSCKCGVGWEGTGAECSDIDECTLNKHNCDLNAWCNNTAGSFECKCNAGYFDLGQGVACNAEASIEVSQAKFSMIWNSTWLGVGKGWRPNYGWQRIKFKVPFSFTPVVVVQVPVAAEREVSPRISRVDRNGFDLQLAFANTTNGTEDGDFFLWLNKTVRTISYMAVRRGIQKLPDGTIVAAGAVDVQSSMKRSTGCTNADVKNAWQKFQFPTFNQRPVLLAQISGSPTSTWKGGGVPPRDFCVPAIRFNATWNESNNSNNSAWVTRICDYRKPAEKNRGSKQIGWIAIGSNFSNSTNSTSFFYNNWTATLNTTVKYASIIGKTNLTHGGSESLNFSQDFTQAPIVLLGKVSTGPHVVGRLDFLGSLSNNTEFKSIEDPTCASARLKQEYANLFVVEKLFTV